MVERVKVEEFITWLDKAPVLDVRSPGEFEQGHIPGAISFPLFTDQERAEVGTLYKQVGKEVATTRGLELVEPRIKEMYEKGVSLGKSGTLLVHCWRGGKRSESVAWLLSISGIKIKLLEGGYKNYRQWVLRQFERKLNLKVVGGRTGSGKTEILQELKEQGEQILDLEKLADHKGSAFGRLGATRHVSQAQFENDLAKEIHHLGERRVWIEDESRGIGKLVIPEPLWIQMRSAEVLYIDLNREERATLLSRIYGIFSKEEILESILKVKDQLGGLKTKEATEALESDETFVLVNILLDYYDKAYSHGLSKRDPSTIRKLTFEKFNATEIARALSAIKD